MLYPLSIIPSFHYFCSFIILFHLHSFLSFCCFLCNLIFPFLIPLTFSPIPSLSYSVFFAASPLLSLSCFLQVTLSPFLSLHGPLILICLILILFPFIFILLSFRFHSFPPLKPSPTCSNPAVYISVFPSRL